jgi:hypothetical protein
LGNLKKNLRIVIKSKRIDLFCSVIKRGVELLNTLFYYFCMVKQVESIKLLKQVNSLKEISLPDEFYAVPKELVSVLNSLKSSPLRDTLVAIGKYKAKGAQFSESDFLKPFENGGKPFKSTILFNHPFFCSKCGKGEGEFTCIIMSLGKNLSVSISGVDFHRVEKHKEEFPPTKLDVLKKIFEK